MTAPINVFCRWCQAKPNEVCRTQAGKETKKYHSDRVRLAAKTPDKPASGGRKMDKKTLRRNNALVNLIANAMAEGAVTLVQHAPEWEGNDTSLIDIMKPYAKHFVDSRSDLTRKVFNE